MARSLAAAATARAEAAQMQALEAYAAICTRIILCLWGKIFSLSCSDFFCIFYKYLCHIILLTLPLCLVLFSIDLSVSFSPSSFSESFLLGCLFSFSSVPIHTLPHFFSSPFPFISSHLPFPVISFNPRTVSSSVSTPLTRPPPPPSLPRTTHRLPLSLPSSLPPRLRTHACRPN